MFVEIYLGNYLLCKFRGHSYSSAFHLHLMKTWLEKENMYKQLLTGSEMTTLVFCRQELFQEITTTQIMSEGLCKYWHPKKKTKRFHH